MERDNRAVPSRCLKRSSCGKTTGLRRGSVGTRRIATGAFFRVDAREQSNVSWLTELHQFLVLDPAGKQRYVFRKPQQPVAASHAACALYKGVFPMAKDPAKKPPATVASEPQELENQIRQRAYELYEAGGREDGHDLDDWLRAEAEIMGTNIEAVAA